MPLSLSGSNRIAAESANLPLYSKVAVFSTGRMKVFSGVSHKAEISITSGRSP